MKQRIERFMRGRYGSDTFNRFICVVSLVFFICALLTDGWMLYGLGIFMLGYSYFRMLSRNVGRRTQENIAFHQLKQAATAGFSGLRKRLRTAWQQKQDHFSQRKTYRFYHCPRCGQQLRVPRGKGKLEISCPKCGAAFLGKS